MSVAAEAILANLQIVADERAVRLAAPGLPEKVAALKEFQQRRFSHTYADLLKTKRYGPASRFFLDELYGPGDFSRRDTQFARVVPALVSLFPNEIVQTVATLAQLHALSESLDTVMAANMDAAAITPERYIQAWQATARAADREAQIVLTLEVASRLDRVTRKPLLRNSLRLMRGPARAAGLVDLQQFLERGFDTFRAMSGAQEFVTVIESRERVLAASLFQADLTDTERDGVLECALAQLPTL